MEHACFFIGQRTAGEEIYPALAEAVERHITGYGVRRFYVGRYGNFDRMAARAVGEAKARHSGVELVLVLPYHPAQHPVPVPPGFDRSLYPWEGERVPPRLAILRTDQRMVERCAFLIAAPALIWAAPVRCWTSPSAGPPGGCCGWRSWTPPGYDSAPRLQRSPGAQFFRPTRRVCPCHLALMLLRWTPLMVHL